MHIFPQLLSLAIIVPSRYISPFVLYHSAGNFVMSTVCKGTERETVVHVGSGSILRQSKILLGK